LDGVAYAPHRQVDVRALGTHERAPAARAQIAGTSCSELRPVAGARGRPPPRGRAGRAGRDAGRRRGTRRAARRAARPRRAPPSGSPCDACEPLRRAPRSGCRFMRIRALGAAGARRDNPSP
jgi:hypothetical protein